MNPYVRLFETLIAEVERGRRCAFCAIVAARGSTPQVSGAAILVREGMTTEGTIGGGCVEAELCNRASRLLQQGESALLTFDLDHDYGWDDGLICGGSLCVAVMTILDEAQAVPFRQAVAAIGQGRQASVPIRVQHEGKTQEYRLLIEAPARLVIAGAGHVGAEVARLAVGLDFETFVVDDRGDMMNRERLPEPVVPVVGDIAATLRRQPIDANTFVVIVTRGHKHDEEALHAVIDSPARYIGMIGSRRKIKLIYDDLVALGVPREGLDRVRAPIGLAIGAVTVPEIAVSIVAQLIEVRRTSKPTRVEGPFSVEGHQGVSATQDHPPHTNRHERSGT
ncbi:MAG: XdhC/CoxI family protein [Planctomycetota bacterium]